VPVHLCVNGLSNVRADEKIEDKPQPDGEEVMYVHLEGRQDKVGDSHSNHDISDGRRQPRKPRNWFDLHDHRVEEVLPDILGGKASIQ
jgi:hypothetical protein